jgi:two-component system phosphate regulon response regulator OmpR
MMQKKAHLLVVDDDKRLRELLSKYLQEAHFLVTTAENSNQALHKLEQEPIDLMVLDIMMPGESGLEFTKSLRKNLNHTKHNVPILMLTALGETEHRITGLETGVDDYLGKPFEPKELLLRIERILARNGHTIKKDAELRFGNKSFDPKSNTLKDNEEVIHLTSAELDLLHIFATNAGMTLSRDELAERCGVSLSPRTIDVQITRLRKKLELDPKKPHYLRTVRHKGYALWPDQ